MVAVDPFRSKRLVYVAFDPKKHLFFFHSIQRHLSSRASLARPVNLECSENLSKQLADNALLFVVICKPLLYDVSCDDSDDVRCDDSDDVSCDERLKSIGTIALKPSADVAYHRCAQLVVNFDYKKKYQAYDSEAISWAVDWAFRTAGLHRVEVSIPGWNTEAVVQHERLGFRVEGRRREYLFKDDRWWDEVHLGILGGEWRELQ